MGSVDTNLDVYLSKLDDANPDIKAKCIAAIEIRDNLDQWCQNGPQHYSGFLGKCIPIILKILDGPPVFDGTSQEQRLRSCVLDILHRLPTTPDLNPETTFKIVDKLMRLVRIENEDNNILIVKTIMDLLRHNQAVLKDRVQAFLDVIVEMFQSMPQTVEDTFDGPISGQITNLATPGNQYSQSPRPSSPVSAAASDLSAEQQQSRHLLKGMQSFKVVSECPIIVISLLGPLHRPITEQYVMKFVPLLKALLMLQAKAQQYAHEEAKARADIHIGVAKEIKNKSAFGDFILLQVKTMNFLAYLLRVYTQQLQDFLPCLPEIVVRLLRDCPREKSAARKELFVAVRHIINFNFRNIFLPKLDELLDVRTLIGDSLTVHETMRPLAFSMIADLVHHLRDSLSPEQIRQAILVFTKSLRDEYPGTSFHTMSAKLLLGMDGCIGRIEPKAEARHNIMMILNGVADRLAAMNAQFEWAVKTSQQTVVANADLALDQYMANKDCPPNWDEATIFTATPIKTQNTRERTANPVNDNKFLFKNLISGLKPLFIQLRNTNPTPLKRLVDASIYPKNWDDCAFGFTPEQVNILTKLFHEGTQAFKYHTDYDAPDLSNLTTAELLTGHNIHAGTKEEKDLLEAFAAVFHQVDPATFHEIFQMEIGHLFDLCVIHPSLIHIAQFLLASQATSPSLCNIFFHFLMTHFEDIGKSDIRRASILLRLFKLSSMAVTLYSADNEQILLPHAITIITRALKSSTTAEEPVNYYLLLRSLFRSIGGGKFEALYTELLPLLEMILDTLNNLLHAARRPADRDLLVELILTVPARLSHLLPHLSYLMRPVVIALQSGPELVVQGLRTLELCIDNLQQDFIDPLTEPFIEDLMTALWAHLKPAPYSHAHSHTAMRILGKLGGRNRKFLSGIPKLDYQAYTDDRASYDIRLMSTNKDRAFPVMIGTDAAIARLKENPPNMKHSTKGASIETTNLFYKRQAFKFIQSQLKLFIALDHIPDEFAQMVRIQAQDLLAGKFDIGEDILTLCDRERSHLKRDAEAQLIKKLLKALHFCHTIPELKDEASAFLLSICKHVMILEVGKTFAFYKHRPRQFEIRDGEGLLSIDSRIIADTITESLASDYPEERDAATLSIRTLWDSAATILGDESQVSRITFFVQMSRSFTHACHQPDWYTKTSGVLGIKYLTSLPFSDVWLIERHHEIHRALLFVLKDVPPVLTAKPRLEAEEILQTLIRKVAKSFQKEDLEKQQSKLFALNKLLIMELAHPSKYVRDLTHKLYHILANFLDIDIVDFLRPVKDGLLQHIFNKPLRALPFSHQIGYLNAITYLITLSPILVPHDDHLNRLILEALFLAESDDNALTDHANEFRKAENLVQLRVGCIKLLSNVLKYDEYQSLTTTKSHIIYVFFKGIYHRSNSVIDEAMRAMRDVVLVVQKLPKDVLQKGLRPILFNLQTPAKLSVESLDGLARLLKLLINYFKIEIGQRLLDHTRAFMDPAVLQKASFHLIEQSKHLKIVISIFNILHLLPAGAVIFLPQFIEKVMELERELRRTHVSSFRAPLIRFLNRYAKAAFEHVAPSMADLPLGRFFAQLLADSQAEALRDVVYSEPNKLVDSLVAPSDPTEKLKRGINAIHIAYAISKHDKTKDLLAKSEPLRQALFEAGQSVESLLRDCERSKSRAPQNPQVPELNTTLRLAAEQAGEQIVDLLMTYLEQVPHNIDFFFEVVDSITSSRLKTRPSMQRFIYKSMVQSDSAEYNRLLILKCIAQVSKPSVSHRVKAYLLHNVVNPIFAMDVQRNWNMFFSPDYKGTELLNKSMINVLHEKIWRPYGVDSLEEGAPYVDHSRMELLQMTALLLKYHNQPLQDVRKDIIKFAWSWMKLEDVVNKHAAYVVIAYFIGFYETPAKIVMTVYQYLLKAHHTEGKTLVTQALDLFAMVVKKRVGDEPNKLPLWARMPKKIIVDEIYNLQQLVSIFNFFCRHPDLFYEAREALAPVIIPHLQKIAASNNDGKRTSLNLVNLIWTWEHKAVLEGSSGQNDFPQGVKRRADGEISNFKPATHGATCVSNPSLRLLLIKFLAQFSAGLPERYPTTAAAHRAKFPQAVQPPAVASEFCRKAITLLHNFLSKPFWNDIELDPLLQRVCKAVLMSNKGEEEKKDFFETKVVNTLQVLKIFVNIKPDTWVVDRLEELWKCVEGPINSDSPQIQDCLHGQGNGDEKEKRLTPLFRRLIDVLPDVPTTTIEDEPDDSPTTQFMTSIQAIVKDGLENGHYISCINILFTMCAANPRIIDEQLPTLSKVFVVNGQMYQEHLAANSYVAPQSRTEPTPAVDPYENDIQVGLFIKTIEILAARIDSLGEQRRPFLTTLATLIERSISKAVWHKVLDLAQDWMIASDPLPTLKEKVAVLSKMLLADQRPDFGDILQRFLQLVLKVYEDPRVTRTELTVRLEQSFLIGCRATDVETRNKFLSIFDKHISRSPNTRLDFVLCGQDWTVLQESFWLSQVIHLLFGSIEMNAPVQLHKDDFKFISPTTYYQAYSKDPRIADVILDDQFEVFMLNHRKFCTEVQDIKLRDIMDPLVQLQHADSELASSIWIALFPIFWANVPKDERREYETNIAQVLSRDFHMRQIDQRPNCIQTLLEGIVRCKPRFKCPPHLVKYLAKTYDVWYTATHFLEEAANIPLVDTSNVRESTVDALLDIYSSLEESDMFYGTWRRRCQYVESNAALSYEQLGMWEKAQSMYEQAQVKARTGQLSFSQGEYMLWEDHFVICSTKLQQWDILSDFAKHENFNDLYIDSMWRTPETWTNTNEREHFDSMIKAVSDAVTPRRAYFMAFMAFLKAHYKGSPDMQAQQNPELQKSIDEALQVNVRKWHQLPSRLTNAHIPLLQLFQHIVELMDSSAVTYILHQTTAANLDQKSSKLKLLFQQWRDRLPNFWDDINAWQDLVTWRTHVFTLVNNVFLPLVNNGQSQSTAPPTQHSQAYRGFHEMAWIINRFANVARLHNLPDVCISHLSKIYTLPNIEIQEAFLKLREQAKCMYQNKHELNDGLDVINCTNMNYFNPNQKSQFFTLKGMFLNKLGQKNEANEAFGTALFYEIKLAKAWAEWGKYNDQMFKADAGDIAKAGAAVSCYLEGAALFKNKRSRKLLSRILWLLSLDTPDKVVMKAMQDYKGEHPVWYWIQFIPQLLLGLSRPEAVIARGLLNKIAKIHPQALFFHLRTCKEDMAQIRKQQELREKEKLMGMTAKNKSQNPAATAPTTSDSPAPGNQSLPRPASNASNTPTESTRNGLANGQANGLNEGDAAKLTTPGSNVQYQSSPALKQEGNENGTNNGSTATALSDLKPWEHADQIMNALKTNSPLLAWSMETIVDQITKNFKANLDEDAYRLINALLADGLSYVNRQPAIYSVENKLPPATEQNISRFTDNVCPAHIRKAFEADFVTVKPTMFNYIECLRKWRNRFEERLDRRTTPIPLESISPHLAEFKRMKLDNVEVPGQYLLHRDRPSDFVRIECFMPDVDLVRGMYLGHKRIRIRGHDGSTHAFAIQHPTARTSRREERVLQLFRMLNDILVNRRETRRRNLHFNLPLAVPLSPSCRLLTDDAGYVSLQGAYEDWCRKNNVMKEDPILFQIQKMRTLNPKAPEHVHAVRLETFLAINESMVPNTVALEFFQSTYPSYADFWLFRRTVGYQLAALTFINFTLHMSGRTPAKLVISRTNGKVMGSELVPTMGAARPIFNNPEAVQFRLTPNMQMLLGPIVMEGIFAPSLMAIARALFHESDDGADMAAQLSVFIRDEVSYWYNVQHRQANNLATNMLRESVDVNTDHIMRRVRSLADEPKTANLPANQSVVDLVANCVNPKLLCQMDYLWSPWL